MQAKVKIGMVAKQILLFHVYLKAEKASAEARRHRLVKLFTNEKMELICSISFAILSFVMNFPY